jgi:hypothetical protein
MEQFFKVTFSREERTMRVHAFSLSLIIMGILTALVPVSVVGQSPNTYTSIILTDVIGGAPVVGSTFTTDLQVSITNNATPPVGILGVEIWVPFDSDVVRVDDADDNPANGTQVEIKNGFFDGNLVVGANEVFDPGSGPWQCGGSACVHVAVSHTGGSGPVTNTTGTVATITWAAEAPGGCGFAIAPDSILSDRDGRPIPINSISVPTVTVTGAGEIRGSVWRQGTQTDHANTDAVALTVGRAEVAESKTSANGGFVLVVPVGSTYTVNAWYPGYLHTQKTDVYVVGATVGIGTTTLVGGDVKRDNCINILDIVLIISKFGQTGLPPEDAVDINDDGLVNILDLTIAAGNFGRCGPTTWIP